jgi:hypothetical protein
MTAAEEIAELQRAILKLHGAQAEHVESVAIKETCQGETVGDGFVEAFEQPQHPAERA